MSHEATEESLKIPEWLSKWHKLRDDFDSAQESKEETAAEEEPQPVVEETEIPPTPETKETPEPEPSQPLPLSAEQKRLDAATRAHQWGNVEKLIAQGTVPAQETLAFIAGQKQSLWPNWAEELIKAGARPTAEMIHTATLNHDWPHVEVFIGKGAVPSEKTLAFIAGKASKQWPNWASELIKAGAKPTPEMIHTATVNHDWPRVEELIKGGAVPSEKTIAFIQGQNQKKWPGWAGELAKARVKKARRSIPSP